jgi:uncharacterized membrane protein
MIIGYYFAEWMIYGSAIAPLASVLGNVIQAAGGMIIAIPLITALKRVKFFQ